MMNEDLLRKVKKCLDLASDSRGDPNVAASALRQAQKMMEANGLTLADVGAASMGEAEAPMTVWRKPPPWEINLGHMVARAFGVMHFYRTFPSHRPMGPGAETLKLGR